MQYQIRYRKQNDPWYPSSTGTLILVRSGFTFGTSSRPRTASGSASRTGTTSGTSLGRVQGVIPVLVRYSIWYRFGSGTAHVPRTSPHPVLYRTWSGPRHVPGTGSCLVPRPSPVLHLEPCPGPVPRLVPVWVCGTVCSAGSWLGYRTEFGCQMWTDSWQASSIGHLVTWFMFGHGPILHLEPLLGLVPCLVPVWVRNHIQCRVKVRIPNADWSLGCVQYR